MDQGKYRMHYQPVKKNYIEKAYSLDIRNKPGKISKVEVAETLGSSEYQILMHIEYCRKALM